MKLPVPAPQVKDLLDQGRVSFSDLFTHGIGAEVDGVYEHWDHLRHLPPPAGLTSEKWWAALKFARAALARGLPLQDKPGDT